VLDRDSGILTFKVIMAIKY